MSWQPARDAGVDADAEDAVTPNSDAAAADAGAGPRATDAGDTDSETEREAPPDAAYACADAAACDAPPPPGPVGVTGFEGASCTPEGAQTCAALAGVRRLHCTSGRLRYDVSCTEGTLCDTASGVSPTGQCRAIGTCEAVNGEGVGCVGSVRARCDATGRALSLLPCDATSHCEGAGECVCDPGSRRGDDGSCESFQLHGVFGQGGAGAYCAADTSVVLGDARGFWVALLFRTFQSVSEPTAVALQRSMGAGWALTETPAGLRFDVADAARGPAPGAYSSAPYVRPATDLELGRTQLAVGVFTGSEVLLYVADRVTGPAVAASFAAATSGLCVLGELTGDGGARGTSSTVVFALAGGSGVPSADEVHTLFRATKQDGVLAGFRDKTQFSFDFSGNSPMTVPVRVDNRAGARLTLEAAGFVGPAGGFTVWGW